MILTLEWQAIGLIIAIAGHALVTVYNTGRQIEKMNGMQTAVDSLKKELEKRDSLITAAFKKIDHVDHRLTRVEARCEINHEKE